MTESLFNYNEITLEKDTKVVFLNGGVEDELFELVAELSDSVETYVNLSIIRDEETAEQFLVALSAILEDAGIIDEDDDAADIPLMISDIIKIRAGGIKAFLVTLVEIGNDSDEDADYDADEDSEEETSEENWD